MRWIEAAFRAGAGGLDALCDALTELGADGLVIEDEADFRRFLEENHQYWDYVDDELEARYRGVSRVKGLAFGTGGHATTRMCLEFLEGFAGEGKRVLDLGCGSGILGIGALVLGCAECTGCDIDPKSPEAAADNAALNGIAPERYHMYTGDVLSDKRLRAKLGAGYDIVLANIVSDVIIPLAPYARECMALGGAFITSGIIDGRQDEVAAALAAAGFEMTAHLTEDGWHAYLCR